MDLQISVLRWSGHMEKMEDSKLVKRVIQVDVGSESLRERPQLE